jgi:signal transduction histidine kinase
VPRTLYGKLTLALFMLLSVVAVAWIIISLRAAESYAQEVRQRLHRELAAHLVADGVLLEGADVDPDGLEEVIHMLMVVNPAIEVYVLDREGNILAYSSPPGAIERQRVALLPIDKFLAGAEEGPLLGDDPRDRSGAKVFSAAPIGAHDDPEGYVYVVLGGSAYDSVAARLKSSFVLRQASLAGAAVLAVVLVLGLLLFHRMTRRLRRLTAEVEAFCAGHAGPSNSAGASRRLASGDEIDQLEESFGAMSRRIRDQLRELSRIDEMRRELVANVSHDLRTPLASLTGYLETLVLKGDRLAPEERDRYLEIATRHASQLGKRVSDLFELARLDARAISPQMEPFSLPELVFDVVQKFSMSAERERISIGVEGRRDLPFVVADIGLVARALENLVGNALRHTSAGGKVTLVMRGGPQSVSVEVRDTGSGIPAEAIGSIFDRYYRSRDVDGETSGAGLGLAITKRIAEIHEGTIEVASKPGEGAMFTLTLPVRQTRDEHHPPALG